MGFKCLVSLSLLSISLTSADKHAHHHQQEFSATRLNDLAEKWGIDWGFTGISTFAHLRHVHCLTDPSFEFDIAVLGVPFDTAVSYRPGARFGPRAIRAASSRQTSFRGFNPRASINPYANWATIVDCGDIPVTPFDNALALRQMTEAFEELGSRPPTAKSLASDSDYRRKPKILSLGGDHSIALAALRTLEKVYGQPISVVHFDSHLDTWLPTKYPSKWLETSGDEMPQSYFNHGSMFWMAGKEGLVANGSSVHAGLRTRLSGIDEEDNWDDDTQGWSRISTDDIDDLGVKGIIEKIMAQVGTEKPVYLSIDIDVIDPGLAPGTGTPEPGGWTTRELIRILRGIEGLNVVGADVVEVSPAYDGPGEATAVAAAQVAFEILSSMVKKGLVESASGTGSSTSDKSKSKDEL